MSLNATVSEPGFPRPEATTTRVSSSAIGASAALRRSPLERLVRVIVAVPACFPHVGQVGWSGLARSTKWRAQLLHRRWLHGNASVDHAPTEAERSFGGDKSASQCVHRFRTWTSGPVLAPAAPEAGIAIRLARLPGRHGRWSELDE